ncbi:hypothetical protein ACTXT7_013276 [Hymenolepis weldensis]
MFTSIKVKAEHVEIFVEPILYYGFSTTVLRVPDEKDLRHLNTRGRLSGFLWGIPLLDGNETSCHLNYQIKSWLWQIDQDSKEVWSDGVVNAKIPTMSSPVSKSVNSHLQKNLVKAMKSKAVNYMQYYRK